MKAEKIENTEIELSADQISAIGAIIETGRAGLKHTLSHFSAKYPSLALWTVDRVEYFDLELDEAMSNGNLALGDIDEQTTLIPIADDKAFGFNLVLARRCINDSMGAVSQYIITEFPKLKNYQWDFKVSDGVIKVGSKLTVVDHDLLGLAATLEASSTEQ